MLACAELFINELRAKNLSFDSGETEKGAVVVDFPYQGKITKCIFDGDEGRYMSLYLSYERIPEEKLAEVIFLCNTLNSEYKWVTFYVDDDNDLFIHDDAILSTENAADEAFELLVRMLRISEEEKPRIMKAIYA